MSIVPGDIGDYKALAHYHYRDEKLGPFTAIYALKGSTVTGRMPAGVIVYTMPSPCIELRSVATGNMFVGFDRSTQLALVNKFIRCIGRVVIEPRFRGLGLAARLVRETMPMMNVPIIESLAVMGHVNPFFEKAGMKVYTSKLPARCVQLIEALSLVGIDKEQLFDPYVVQQNLEQLRWPKADFIEKQTKLFLQSYGRHRGMQPGIERTRFVLKHLTERPVYYIWFNEEIKKAKCKMQNAKLRRSLRQRHNFDF